MPTFRDAALELCGVLEGLGIAYVIGGSYASSVHGIGRQTQDLDVVADIFPHHAGLLAAALSRHFYADEELIREALRRGQSFNVIHLATAFKLDIFPASGHLLGQQQLKRKQVAETSVLGPPPLALPVISAEDTILVKLRWYLDGGKVSERQWNDVQNIVRLQGTRLDRRYLREWAAKLEVVQLLEQLLAEF